MAAKTENPPPTSKQEKIVKRISRRIGELMRTPTCVMWLKRDEIEQGVIAVMAGPRGVYKSTVALHWIMYVCVTLGLPVFWLSGEGRGAGRRVAAWLKKFAPDVDPETIPLHIVDQRFNLNVPEGRQAAYDELTAIAEEEGAQPVLCVIDTYSKFNGGLQVKDNAATSAFVTGIDKAIRVPFNCTVLIVTHTGLSDQGRPLGAQALESDTDAAYVVSRDPAGIVYVSRERFKDSAELPPLKFKPEVIDLGYTDGDGKPVTACVVNVTDDAPRYQPKAQKPAGENQRVAHEVLKELSPFGDAVDMDDVATATLERRGVEPSSDKRRDVRLSIKALADKRLAWVSGNECGGTAIRPDTKVFN